MHLARAFGLALLLVAAPPPARSGPLRSGLSNPMPGGTMAGYAGDTGLDIAGLRLPVYAIAAGTLDYSERGHTLWTGRGDTPNCVRVALDQPIAWRGRRITHVYYAHLSELAFAKAEGSAERIHVDAGDRLGTSGFGRGSPHLHLGLLLDGNVEQDSWDDLLTEDAVREVLGRYRAGERLPGR
jgi:murein DD-endopeptidase MepM/ murein hydrolase activator NlpD